MLSKLYRLCNLKMLLHSVLMHVVFLSQFTHPEQCIPLTIQTFRVSSVCLPRIEIVTYMSRYATEHNYTVR